MITPLTHRDRANAMADLGALFVINHSGGKDSQSMMIRLLEIVPRTQLLVVHAALGEVEWHGALEHAETQAGNAEVPFVVARATKTLLEMVEYRFEKYPHAPSFPQASNRQCTSDLKRGPIEREVRRYAKTHGFSSIVTCMGLRASESSKRAKMAAWRTNAAQSIAGRTWVEWLPIHDLTTAEVFETISRAGQEPHPAYAAGNERLSCVFCILGSAKDARNGAIQRPELYQRYVELEARTGYTAHQSRKSLVEITGLSVGAAFEAHRRLPIFGLVKR